MKFVNFRDKSQISVKRYEETPSFSLTPNFCSVPLSFGILGQDYIPSPKASLLSRADFYFYFSVQKNDKLSLGGAMPPLCMTRFGLPKDDLGSGNRDAKLSYQATEFLYFYLVEMALSKLIRVNSCNLHPTYQG